MTASENDEGDKDELWRRESHTAVGGEANEAL
jgi:hypothetical protein